MSILDKVFCRPDSERGSAAGEKTQLQEKSAKTKSKTKKSPPPPPAQTAPRHMKFMSIKFLYQNPIGRQLTKENLSRTKDPSIWRAKDDPHLDRDVQLQEYILSVPNAIRYRGLLLQGYLVYAKVLRRIEHFEVRPDDVWLITYPKSGTTWMEEILSLIRADGDLGASNRLLAKRVPHLEVGKPIGHMKWLRKLPAPRLVATHLPVEHIPAQLRSKPKAKIIYVVRNPKDNAVSYYHHHRMSTFLGNYSGTWSNFLQLFAKGHLVYGDWYDHVAGYWELAQRYPDQVLFVSYEELKIDLPSMIGRISAFIGHPLSADQVAQIARQCSFEKMKTNTMVNREVLPVKDLFDMSQSKFMRKGIIGDWRNHFSQEESDQFDALYRDRLKSIGLDLAQDHEEAERLFAAGNGRIIHQVPLNKIQQQKTTLAIENREKKELEETENGKVEKSLEAKLS